MNFQFKIQPFQTESVKSITAVLNHQPKIDAYEYTRDLGNILSTAKFMDDTGYSNPKILLSDETLLQNIREIQKQNNITLSDKLSKNLGRFILNIEMETGTGKTYVYIKSIFELNEQYGFNKFIIVVPSIAIREGVKKSFDMTKEHFFEQYKKKIEPIIYSSKSLHDIDYYSNNNNINVMIINSQSFNSKDKEQRKIYEKQDSFGSRRPIDVIAANHPILIMDEPQRLGGDKTQESLKSFNPLFCLNFSATHKVENNLVYRLDALDAYNQKLVKKIEVKGFELKNLKGTDSYLYLQNIILTPNKAPRAKIELEIKRASGAIVREARIVGDEDNLYNISNELEQYKNNYIIKEIDVKNDSVIFLNNETITKGEIVGDITENNQRRIQIRETIISHFEKEKRLFKLGIKTLSLFFIDEVAKYRQYDTTGQEIDGEYGKIFAEEYENITKDFINENIDYAHYIEKIDVNNTHKGYFSIDKKTKRLVNPEVKKGDVNDVSAYDLILKDKERLLSFDEPTRFIFSHSALREGWDNPNVFQICMLRHTDNTISKRQEVGRGLRLAVNKNGVRIDSNYDENVHNINKLTVIANESYTDFVTTLQQELINELSSRPTKANIDYFKNTFADQEAKLIHRYLIKNDYIDGNDNVTDKYKQDVYNNATAPLPETLTDITDKIHDTIQSIFDKSKLPPIENGIKTKLENQIDKEKFKEFQNLWDLINNKYTYRVDFKSDELIKNAINSININLNVAEVQYVISIGEQESDKGENFGKQKSKTEILKSGSGSRIKYDLIGKIKAETSLTRVTIAKILTKINADKFNMFKANPEEFIAKVAKLINEQKATMVVDYIKYNRLEDKYDSDIFTVSGVDRERAINVKKNIQPYISADSKVESIFAENLDAAEEVNVYSKLPRTLKIPTPLGAYSPDWAIVFKDSASVKHIYFVAETKGKLGSLEINPIEKAKIECAKKLFNTALNDKRLTYDQVTSYQDIMNLILDK